ncbi:DNA polymerase thumb domain-containing protein [Streptomyces rimosus]|uniref:DNA polymerase Y family protein n=1 Tax=Streptomyces rimosus TaxID=1927 RepID=UPI00099CC169|nr:helix-hairpin-helix domain-containing protein [Streptomyces rimosus]
MTLTSGAAGGSGTPAEVLYVRFRAAGDGGAEGGQGASLGEETYGHLLRLLGQFTPVIEALPPDAALADVRGALRYFERDAAGIAELIRLRALAWYGVRCTIGIAGNPLLARMAAQGAAPGEVRRVHGDAVADFLDRKPAAALHGVGPATARALCAYGLDSVGRIAAAPPATLQRILGAKTGRAVHDKARGIDPSPVTPNAAARSIGAEHRFAHDELDPDRRRRALLSLADDLGARLRGSGRAARALTLTVRYADRSTTTRTRRLSEPTAHGPALTDAAYALHAALGLQRARVRSVALRAEDLCRAELATRQLTFDPAEDKARRIEAAVDRARARFGEAAARPAAKLAQPYSRSPYRGP